MALLLDYWPESPGSEVPDPYYGGEGDFTRALALIEQGAIALLESIIEAEL